MKLIMPKLSYQNLFNSIPSDMQHLQDIRKQVKNRLVNKSHTEAHVSMDIVYEAVKKLKSEKSDGDCGLFSNHVSYASKLFFHNITGLFSAILIHGHQPELMLRSSIVSIPKDTKGNLCVDSNYRGIALMSSIAKLFDYVLLLRNNDCLRTSDLQFAFKAKHGTTLCSLVAKEVISYYMLNGTNVAACLLDATKAFDRLRFDKLFQILLDRNVNAIDLRSLMDLYSRQQTRTSWKKQHSDYFPCTNGIRQGAIASPVLYCAYMDVLLERLKKEGHGCWVGEHFAGSVCYADDLMLLSPSFSGLQKMILICQEYAAEFGMAYNPKKTVCILFSRACRKAGLPEINLNDSPLEWVSSVKHLGNHVLQNLGEADEIMNKKGDFIGRINTIIANFPVCPDSVAMSLLRTQCGHMYGCQAWNLADRRVNEFHTTWNRGVRRLLGLPYQTHRRFLPQLAGMQNSESQVFRRVVKLVQGMCTSDNRIVRYLGQRGTGNANTIIGQNLRYISRACDVPLQRLFTSKKLLSTKLSCSQDDLCTIKAIQDIRLKHVDSEFSEFMQFLCVK